MNPTSKSLRGNKAQIWALLKHWRDNRIQIWILLIAKADRKKALKPLLRLASSDLSWLKTNVPTSGVVKIKNTESKIGRSNSFRLRSCCIERSFSFNLDAGKKGVAQTGTPCYTTKRNFALCNQRIFPLVAGLCNENPKLGIRRERIFPFSNLVPPPKGLIYDSFQSWKA